MSCDSVSQILSPQTEKVPFYENGVKKYELVSPSRVVTEILIIRSLEWNNGKSSKVE